ncbi:hypothetical protein ACTD5D_40385 [Nocardia takedensis]|uniref:hypothetical protein n=1 Tax=Nocardia takedensis TaxID=259390 RepID=UPI003F760C38
MEETQETAIYWHVGTVAEGVTTPLVYARMDGAGRDIEEIVTRITESVAKIAVRGLKGKAKVEWLDPFGPRGEAAFPNHPDDVGSKWNLMRSAVREALNDRATTTVVGGYAVVFAAKYCAHVRIASQGDGHHRVNSFSEACTRFREDIEALYRGPSAEGFTGYMDLYTGCRKCTYGRVFHTEQDRVRTYEIGAGEGIRIQPE